MITVGETLARDKDKAGTFVVDEEYVTRLLRAAATSLESIYRIICSHCT